MIFNNPSCKHIRKFPVTYCNNERDPKERAPQPLEELFRRKLQVVKKLLKRKRARSRPEKERNRYAGWVTVGKGRKVGNYFKRRTNAEIARDNREKEKALRNGVDQEEEVEEESEESFKEEPLLKAAKVNKPNKKRPTSRIAER